MPDLFGGKMNPSDIIKDHKPLREAVVFAELQKLPWEKLQEFVQGPEGKYLIENDIITGDTLERLANEEYNDRQLILTVQHMAKECGDDRWDEIVRHRREERRLMDELIAAYGEAARPVVDKVVKGFIETSIPKGYRS